MKKILLTLLSLLVTSVAFASIPDEPVQPDEQTLAPGIAYELVSETCALVTLQNYDEPDVVIYFRVNDSDWLLYDAPFYITETGEYRVEAYAQADGKLPSEVVVLEFVLLDHPVIPELTATPTMSFRYISLDPQVVQVEIQNQDDDDAVIYYEVNESEQWIDYTEPIYFTDPGQYLIYAYAVAPGKEPSNMGAIMFAIDEPHVMEEATPPIIVCTHDEYGYVDVEIVPDGDNYGQTYYFNVNNGDWAVYTGTPLHFEEPGTYLITAYAEEDAKMPSDMVSLEFVIDAIYNPYDFVEDGIYYKITGDDKVKVTFEDIYYNSYSGVVNIPKTVTHDGVTYRVTAIGDNAFRDSGALTGVTIGGYVTEIGTAAFRNCTALTSVELGNYVITVGDEAFYGCNALTDITIGSGVRTIGEVAFNGCNPNATINCKPATPPVLGYACFSNATQDNAILNVHPAVLESYQVADKWKFFDHIQANEALDPVAGDVDGDGELGISDVSTLIDLLLNQ